jgi:hypothetical protein
MYEPEIRYRYFEYDPQYDVRANNKYFSSKIGLIGFLLLFFIGIMQITFTLIDMDWGVYNLQKKAIPRQSLIWTENPFWPTYGKGFWVGLILVANAILGLTAHKECSYTSVSYLFLIKEFF